jgi:hypothetical protein
VRRIHVSSGHYDESRHCHFAGCQSPGCISNHCLGIAPIYCDTHDEDDWEELQALAQLVPAGSVLYGIPSGAALASHPDGSVRAFGGEVHRFVHRDGKVVRLENLTPEAAPDFRK